MTGDREIIMKVVKSKESATELVCKEGNDRNSYKRKEGAMEEATTGGCALEFASHELKM